MFVDTVPVQPTVNNTFKASLADDLSINASGVTLEEAVFNLKSMVNYFNLKGLL